MDFGTAMNIVILITNINSYCIVRNYINKLYTYAPYIDHECCVGATYCLYDIILIVMTLHRELLIFLYVGTKTLHT